MKTIELSGGDFGGASLSVDEATVGIAILQGDSYLCYRVDPVYSVFIGQFTEIPLDYVLVTLPGASN